MLATRDKFQESFKDTSMRGRGMLSHFRGAFCGASQRSDGGSSVSLSDFDCRSASLENMTWQECVDDPVTSRELLVGILLCGDKEKIIRVFSGLVYDSSTIFHSNPAVNRYAHQVLYGISESYEVSEDLIPLASLGVQVPILSPVQEYAMLLRSKGFTDSALRDSQVADYYLELSTRAEQEWETMTLDITNASNEEKVQLLESLCDHLRLQISELPSRWTHLHEYHSQTQLSMGYSGLGMSVPEVIQESKDEVKSPLTLEVVNEDGGELLERIDNSLEDISLSKSTIAKRYSLSRYKCSLDEFPELLHLAYSSLQTDWTTLIETRVAQADTMAERVQVYAIVSDFIESLSKDKH